MDFTDAPPVLTAFRSKKGARRSLDLLRFNRQHVTKRAFDLVGSALILVCVAVIMALVAAIIKISQGGPVFYHHRRVGMAGREFDCLKFRTMVTNGDEMLEKHFAAVPAARREWESSRKLTVDPRVTPLGQILRKSSIDELPQLINVLRGDMSLVGPRPVVQEELRHYGQFSSDYLSVRPGLTGIWQVSGRSDVSYETRVRMDREYLKSMSLSKDVEIILKTIPAVFSSRGSY